MKSGVKATIAGVTKRIETKPNKTEGIINYDVDNAYPQRIVDILNSSGTGTLCTDMFGKYLFGEGFEDETLAKTIINLKGEDVNKLLFKVRKSFSKFYGLAIHVNYNLAFEISSLHFIPFEDLRLTTNDKKNKHKNMLALYDDWQKRKRTRIDHKKIEYFNFFNPNPAVIQKEIADAGDLKSYKGQILYWTIEGPQYTLAPSDSVLEDVQSDFHAKIFKNRNITTNFMPSHVMEVAEFESDDDFDAFGDTLTDFQGADNASKILVMEKKSDDGKDESSFKLTKLDIQDVEKLYEFTENSVRDNIIRNYLIPPILLMAIPGKLGSSSEIREATASYNGTTREFRHALSIVFRDLMSIFHLPVGDNFDIIEVQPSVLDAKDTQEGKKSIVEVLTKSELTPQVKKALLINIYDLTEDEATELIGELPNVI